MMRTFNSYLRANNSCKRIYNFNNNNNINIILDYKILLYLFFYGNPSIENPIPLNDIADNIMKTIDILM